MVAFLQVPSNNFSPGAYVEAGFGGGASNLPRATFIVGYTHGATPGPLLEPKQISGTDHDWPRESQIASKIRAFRRVNPNAELWACAIDDPSGGSAATVDVTVTGPATADGSIPLYLGDQKIDVGVSSGDTDAEIAAAIVAAAAKLPDAHIAVSNASAVLTFTAKMTGVEGNHLTVGFAEKQGQKIPEGVGGLVRTQLASGSGSGDITTALATVLERRFFAMSSGLSDSTAITALVEEAARRWGATVELHGQAFVGVRGAVAAQAALGEGYNAEELTAMGSGLSLSPQWDWSAAAAARDVQKTDPLLGWLGMKLTGLDAPETDYTKGERDTLLSSGVSTFRVDSGGVILDRLVTTRTQDADSNTDYSLLALTKRRALEYLAFNWRSRVYNKYIAKSYKIATSDDVTPAQGSRIVTPSTLRAEAVAWFIERRAEGIVQNLEAFIEALIAEVNGADETRMDMFLAPTLLDELVTIATNMEAR